MPSQTSLGPFPVTPSIRCESSQTTTRHHYPENYIDGAPTEYVRFTFPCSADATPYLPLLSSLSDDGNGRCNNIGKVCTPLHLKPRFRSST
eukprot:scaffold8828_cov204-Amphora_coffeaeformis.AAC.25